MSVLFIFIYLFYLRSCVLHLHMKLMETLGSPTAHFMNQEGAHKGFMATLMPSVQTITQQSLQHYIT